MKMAVYIFDFDGVICHSAIETGYVAWQCARRLWPAEFPSEDIPDAVTRSFLDIRPYLEYGAEAIVMLKLLMAGWAPERFAVDFAGHSAEHLAAVGKSKSELVAIFGGARDALIRENPCFWLGLNHCYHESILAVQSLLKQKSKVVILTTKEERFVKLILKEVGISLPDDCIVGMESGRVKKEVVAEFVTKYPDGIAYVEDRLESLKAVRNDVKSAGKVKLYLADWGYASEEQLVESQNMPDIRRISSLREVLE